MSSEEEEGSVPRVLARNTACHQCRKRKLKCDAVKPTCTNCQRHNNRQANASNPRVLECTWDEPRRRRARLEDAGDEELGGPKRARMAELEAKIAEFERKLKERDDVPSGSSKRPRPDCDEGAGYDARALAESECAGQMSSWQSGPKGAVWPNELPLLGTGSSGGPSQYTSPDAMHLTWPNWPVDLPALDVIEHVVEVFFERVPILPKMLHKATFKANLALPPTHWKFPARPLLHAILAITANHLPIEVLGTRRYFPSGTPLSSLHHPEYDFEPSRVQDRFFPTGAFHFGPQGGESSASNAFAKFQLWHRRKAMNALSLHLDRGDKLLECAQAYVITATVDQYNAWWTDLWMLSGSAMRLAIPIRLNESSKFPRDALLAAQNVLMEPARDAFEQACRDRTWWMVYLLERSVTLSTCWSPSLHDDEITTELPVLQSTFDRAWGDLEGVQNFQSPNFYSDHPERHADSFVLYIKGIRLVTELSTFLRAYSRTSHSVSKYTNDPRIRLLLSKINAFRMSFPPKFRKVAQAIGGGPPDVEAISAIMMTHMVTTMIGEPLITKDTWESDLARMALTAIRASLSLLYDITATSFDLTLLPSLCVFSWGVASGALCRFIVAATETGDTVSAGVFRSEVQVFRMAMQQYAEKYPVGQRNVKMLDDTLEMTSRGAVFHCEAMDILDPDYIPGAVKTKPGRSVETSSSPENIPTSSGFSAKVSNLGLPELPGSEFLRQSRLRGQNIRMKRVVESSTGTSPSTDTLNPNPNIVTPPDLSIGAESSGSSFTQQDFVSGQPFFSTGLTPASGSADMNVIPGMNQPSSNIPSWAYDFTGQANPQNFMATAMGFGMDTTSFADFGAPGNDNGFGFDINNFSFDIGDFSSLLGMTTGPAQTTDQNKYESGYGI